MNKEQIIDFYTSNNVEMPNICCKDCGKLLIYDGADVHINSRDNTKLVHSGITFLSSKEYGGNTYNLCRCRECVEKKYPQVKNVRFLYAQKAAFYTQYAFDVPDDIFKQYAKERQSITKDRMIAKYGKEEGLRRWNSYCKKQSDTNTFEYKHEKYGMTLDEFKEFNKSRACTKELFIKRYGEIDGSQKWDNYCERQRYTTQPEYFIEKYGEDVGKQKFNDFCDKRTEAGKHSTESTQSTSLIADNLFKQLIDFFPNNKIWTHVSKLGEKTVNHKFSIDYYDETANIVIEFFGDYWHMNPLKFNENDPIPFITKNECMQTAKDMWKCDKTRIDEISMVLNTRSLVVWEYDYRKNKEKTLQTILNFYKQDSKNIL